MAITDWEICRAAMEEKGIRIVLCDDDPAFSAALGVEITRTLERLNLQAVISAFDSPASLTPELLAEADLIFLDIDFENDDQNGIDIARRLRQVNRRALIFFVTNFIDYAPAGYEVQAFRYILKRDRGEVLERYILQALENLAEGLGILRLRDREQTVDLPLEQITYLEVLDHYVSVHNGETAYTMGATLSSLEKQLESHGFLRIHKSYLVNMRCIRKLRSRECLLADGTVLAVSEKNYSQQKQKYLLWKGSK